LAARWDARRSLGVRSQKSQVAVTFAAQTVGMSQRNTTPRRQLRPNRRYRRLLPTAIAAAALAAGGGAAPAALAQPKDHGKPQISTPADKTRSVPAPLRGR
jgi:hypothetical protein